MSYPTPNAVVPVEKDTSVPPDLMVRIQREIIQELANQLGQLETKMGLVLRPCDGAERDEAMQLPTAKCTLAELVLQNNVLLTELVVVVKHLWNRVDLTPP